MTGQFNFYYDESEHSRKINKNTVSAQNYIAFVAFLNYLNQFNSAKDMKRISTHMHTEYFNSWVCECLQDHFNKMRLKLPIEPLPPTGEDFFYNQRGAKCFFDTRRQPMIEVNEAKLLCFPCVRNGLG